MKIGFEASNAVGEKPTGVAIYIKNFIESINALKSGRELKIFYKPARLKKKEQWLKINGIPEQTYFSPFFKDVDIIHGLDTFVPNWKNCRKVVSFHDILPLLFPDEMITPKDFRLKKEKDYRRTLAIADQVITVSESTKNDLVEYFQISPAKIETVYPGVNADFFQKKNEEEVEKVRQRYGLEKDYLLFVGTISGRKNTARLVEAFARTKASKDLQLVLAGSISYMGELTLDAIRKNNLGARVKIAGYIENRELPALYTGAKGFLFPTVYEGFGFPVLEAMLCETPVLTSNIGASFEIGGDFAIYADPLDTQSIASGIDELLANHHFDGKSARAYAKQFSWKNAAQKVLRIYEEMLK